MPPLAMIQMRYDFRGCASSPNASRQPGSASNQRLRTSGQDATGPHQRTTTGETTVAYEVPPLPYDYAALEPHIDEATMKLHHDKHHQAYLTNLNGAVEKHPDLAKKHPEELLKDLNAIPEDVRKVVQNNGGGHVNHTMFWQIMKPKGGGDPSGDIAPQIKVDFGAFESFKKLFNETTAKQFSPGWGRLLFHAGKLALVATAHPGHPIPH